MADLPNLVSPWTRIPTIHEDTDLFTAPTMAALDALYAGGGGQEVRHDSDATYSYMGSADAGTAEGSTGWDVTRITLTSPPVIETGTGTWSGRAGITYS